MSVMTVATSRRWLFRPALEAGTVGLGFRNSVTGEMSYVQAAGDPWFCHGGVMHVDRDGVVWDYGEYDNDRRWTVWVPWGDLGYPLFVRPHGASWDLGDLGRHVWPSRRGDRVQFGSGVADLSLTVAGDEVIGVGTPGGSSSYLVSSRPIEDRFGSGDWTGGLPGFVIDEYFAAREAAGSAGLAPEEYFTFDEGAGPESWPWWPESVPEGFFAADDPNNQGWFGVVFAGTDGQHYGLTIRFDEPACGGNLTYVVDAVSGEIATCGWSWVGPLLVAPVDAVDPSFVPVLPELSMGDDYRDGAQGCWTCGIGAHIWSSPVTSRLSGCLPARGSWQQSWPLAGSSCCCGRSAGRFGVAAVLSVVALLGRRAQGEAGQKRLGRSPLLRTRRRRRPRRLWSPRSLPLP